LKKILLSPKQCYTAILFALGVSVVSLPACNDPSSKKDKTEEATQKAVKEAQSITLPMLDALFFEKEFEAELKTKLQLSDEQLQKLKEAARASVADLDEDGTNYLGSTKAAMQLSKERIVSIIGEQKTQQLYQLAADKFANGDVIGLWPTEPNSIPKDTRIVVNAPAFRMDVFNNGKLVKSYKVGIGYPEFPLPMGMRRIDQIIFNPTWTPPDEPWVKGKVKAGEKVAAGSKLNPLGPIKIPIGLPSLIHGGKATEKLGNFASHGCVGLTNAQVQEFAELLSQLGATPVSRDSVLLFEQQKTKTKTVKLAKPIPVELRYETIVVEQGNLYLYRDLYEQGTNTMEHLAKVLAVYGLKYDQLTAQEKALIVQGLADMNRDAKGEPVANTDSGNATNKKSSNAKVTRTIAGQKEIVIPIAQLQGKGYPAAVALNAGAPTVTNATP